MHTATADPLVGRTLEGRYRILERIARGGMSTVYAAVDERLDRLVAVKVMSAALSSDPAFSDRFSREARTAARLTHVNAVAVYDQGYDVSADGHHVFLVMELVGGRTLRQLMRERGRFSPAEAVSIMEPVLSALSAAHRAGLVHRDVKPENILLSDEGVVKVADFGLARAVETDAAATRTGLMMGTVAYCPPEQISKGSSDQRADVYSAGVVLFELLVGETPYQGESAMNIAYQHVHSRVPAPSSRVKGIPEQLDEIVVDVTDSDPTGRPADAGEFLARLADARVELALPVVPIPPRPRGQGERLRELRATADARTGTVDDDVDARTEAVSYCDGGDTRRVGGRALLEDSERGERPPPPVVIPPPPSDDPAPRRRRRRRGLIALILVLLLGAACAVTGWWFAAGRYSHVPDVRGESLAAAKQAIADAGYQVGDTSNEFSETVDKGAVISTDPGHGSRVPRGRTVSVVISLGKDRITVPDVSKMTVPQAKDTLQGLGLLSVVTEHSSEKVKENHIIGTDPPAKSKVKRDKTIKIIVSTGPPVIDVPDIEAGTPADDAVATLNKAGFKTAQTKEYSTDVDEGDVISISPTGRAVKGSIITLTVSKGPQMVTVPQIGIQDSLSDAESALTAVGLHYRVQTGLPGGPGNVVLKVSPKSGASVQIGTTVVITVF